MPTYRHTPTGKRFFFAHIPRTAGRFIEANLANNDCVWDESHMDTGLGVMSVVHGVELAHFIEVIMKSIWMCRVFHIFL